MLGLFQTLWKNRYHTIHPHILTKTEVEKKIKLKPMQQMLHKLSGKNNTIGCKINNVMLKEVKKKHV